MPSPRIMWHVQHLMGSGHQHRAAAVTRAMCEQGMKVTYVSGGFPVPNLNTGCAEFVQLAPARSPDMRYRLLVGDGGSPVDDAWKKARRDRLLDSFARYRPDALIVETFPFGRRLLRFELLPLLEAARAARPRPCIVSSVRDILEQRSKPGRNEEVVELVKTYFDAVLVHSDPEFVPLEASFPLVDRIRDKLHYTGYVMQDVEPSNDTEAGDGEVVVSAGGGAFGEHVLRAAMAARPLSLLAEAPWRILVGQNLAQDRFEQLQARAGDGLIVERNRTDFTKLLRRCQVSISQGGYNTVLEVLHAGAPAVVVPYSDEREQEQAVRARLLARSGAIHIVENHQLSPRRLAAAVDAAFKGPKAGAPKLDTRGAPTSARLVGSFLARST